MVVWLAPSAPCNGFARSDGRLPRRFGTRTDVAVYVWLGLGVSSDEEGAILLDYFGETKSEDCGHCDVCVERRKEKRSLEEVCHMIETMMADGRPRQVDEFCSDRFSKEKVAEALQYLTDEEILTSDDGFYRMVEGKNR